MRYGWRENTFDIPPYYIQILFEDKEHSSSVRLGGVHRVRQPLWSEQNAPRNIIQETVQAVS